MTKIEGKIASVSYACILGMSESALPCGHVIRFGCLQTSDQSSESARYPGIVMMESSILGSTKNQDAANKRPYTIEYHPDLSGVRILSLDGEVFELLFSFPYFSLKTMIGLDLRIAEFFNRIVGTSAGEISYPTNIPC